MVKNDEGYIPGAGDIVWLDFAPQSGHEQSGRRPALILSDRNYNSKTSLAIACPITSHQKGYPFEVVLQNQKTQGVILADQIKSLDWRARNTEFKETCHVATTKAVKELISLILDLPEA